MFRLTIRGLWAHKLRFALTGLAVVLGVAFMAGTMILTDTMGRTFDNLVSNTNQGIDAIVRRGSAIDGEFVDARERIDASTLETIRATDGVAAAEGSIQGFAQLVNADGTTKAANGLGMTIGTSWIADERLNPFSLADGRAPERGEMVIDKATADREGWVLGDTVTVLAKEGPETFTLSGIATFGQVDGIPGSSLVATDVETAQRLFAEPGRFDTIVVAAEAGTTPEQLAVHLQAGIGDTGIEVTTGEADTVDKQADLRKDLSFFNTFLLAFAYVALFVGMFIIYNTFSIVVAQRTKDLAMLRAVGASRRQVLWSVFVEAVAVGVLASAAGLALGVVMSFGLKGLLATAGIEIPSGPVVLTTATIVTAAVVGIVVTVLSAIAPALRASRVAPIAALRDVAVDRSHLSITRVIAGLLVVGGGVAGVAAGIAGDGQGALRLLALGAVTTVLGVFVLSPVIARPALRVLGAPALLVSGKVGHLARENARRNPKRTAATATALMVGVALVGFITILASSATAAVGENVDRAFRADYVVDSGTYGEGGFATELEAQLAGLPEVATISAVRAAPVSIDGGTTEVTGVDTAVLDGLYDLKVTEGSLAEVHDGTIAVKADTATEHGLVLGDTVTVTFGRTGPVELTVAALFEDELQGSGGNPWMIGLDTFEANVSDQYDRQVLVATVDGIDAAISRAAIDQVLEAWPNAELQDQAEFKESITSEIGQILNLIYGLLALAVIIALIGIANTLALSVHERRRELGLLRAVGGTRRQIRTTVRWESVMIALLGTGLGVVLALAGAWAIIQGLAGEGINSVVVPTVPMLIIVGLAGLAGVAAAVGPARRAARLDVLAAIATA